MRNYQVKCNYLVCNYLLVGTVVHLAVNFRNFLKKRKA